MSAEHRFYHNTVLQREYKVARDPEMPSDMDTTILFRYDEVTANRWLEAPEPVVYGPLKTLSREKCFVLLSDVKQCSKRPSYIELMAEKLSGIGLPEDEQAAVINKLFRVVEVAIPEHVINVCVLDVTLRYLDSTSDLGPGGLTRFLWQTQVIVQDDDRLFIDRNEMEEMQAMEAFEPKPIDAAKSFSLDDYTNSSVFLFGFI